MVKKTKLVQPDQKFQFTSTNQIFLKNSNENLSKKIKKKFIKKIVIVTQLALHGAYTVLGVRINQP